MIANAEKYYNIKLFYLGANQDAILEANKLGINNNQALYYSETTGNVDSAYRSAATAAKRHASGEHVALLHKKETPLVKKNIHFKLKQHY